VQHQEEILEPVVEKLWKCKHCVNAFKQKFNLNKHLKQVHGPRQNKNMKHIWKDDHVLCPVCKKEFASPRHVRDHIIKKHTSKDLIKANVDPSVIVRDASAKKNVKEEMKTDLQMIKEAQSIMKGANIDFKLLDIITDFAEHCPRLFLLA
jgi:hypothetical protein